MTDKPHLDLSPLFPNGQFYELMPLKKELHDAEGNIINEFKNSFLIKSLFSLSIYQRPAHIVSKIKGQNFSPLVKLK